jgi:hypothetical protein
MKILALFHDEPIDGDGRRYVRSPGTADVAVDLYRKKSKTNPEFVDES